MTKRFAAPLGVMLASAGASAADMAERGSMDMLDEHRHGAAMAHEGSDQEVHDK